MQRRTFLLLVLLLVLSAFYVSVTRQGVPEIASRQKEQTEQFNQLDENALAQPRSAEATPADQ